MGREPEIATPVYAQVATGGIESLLLARSIYSLSDARRLPILRANGMDESNAHKMLVGGFKELYNEFLRETGCGLHAIAVCPYQSDFTPAPIVWSPTQIESMRNAAEYVPWTRKAWQTAIGWCRHHSNETPLRSIGADTVEVSVCGTSCMAGFVAHETQTPEESQRLLRQLTKLAERACALVLEAAGAKEGQLTGTAALSNWLAWLHAATKFDARLAVAVEEFIAWRESGVSGDEIVTSRPRIDGETPSATEWISQSHCRWIQLELHRDLFAASAETIRWLVDRLNGHFAKIAEFKSLEHYWWKDRIKFVVETPFGIKIDPPSANNNVPRKPFEHVQSVEERIQDWRRALDQSHKSVEMAISDYQLCGYHRAVAAQEAAWTARYGPHRGTSWNNDQKRYERQRDAYNAERARAEEEREQWLKEQSPEEREQIEQHKQFFTSQEWKDPADPPPWGRDILREIELRHGVSPDDPRVYSIAKYKGELAEIEAEWQATLESRNWPPVKKDSPDMQEWVNESRLFGVRKSDLTARHFGKVKDGTERQSLRHLWIYLTTMRDGVDNVLRPACHDSEPLPTSPTAARVYSALHHLKIKDAPKPPYPKMTNREWLDELTRIANELEEGEAAELDTKSRPVNSGALAARSNRDQTLKHLARLESPDDLAATAANQAPTASPKSNTPSTPAAAADGEWHRMYRNRGKKRIRIEFLDQRLPVALRDAYEQLPLIIKRGRLVKQPAAVIDRQFQVKTGCCSAALRLSKNAASNKKRAKLRRSLKNPCGP